ncbi:hypothetical protein DFH11DRAFT_70112 [Phellopilus nigrolimitatus]|nr:hypothetical protein DFH11DRAFT_70112 [Phellopilus nigrolimitatus]
MSAQPSTPPPPPPLQNPIKGTTVDTAPTSLGLDDSVHAHINTTQGSSTSQSTPRARAPSAPKSVLKRTVEQTAAKLGGVRRGSGSDGSGSAQTQPGTNSTTGRLSASLTAADPRRFLSLKGKGKGRERDSAAEVSGTHLRPVRPPLASRSTSNLRQPGAVLDDSPFIRPRSPSPSPPPSLSPPSRPSLETFRALGSMRAGTQTLIQAIQAMPWTDEPEGDDEAIPPTALNSDSSEEEQTGHPLASVHSHHS